jgi:inosine/xanthosine triphosphatase
MQISIGTLNPVKVGACEDELKDHFGKYQILSYDVASEIDDQPHGLESTLQGARNRAKNAFDITQEKPIFSIGIEDGSLSSDCLGQRTMNICCACLYDGNQFFFATSSSFMLPRDVSELMQSDGIELSDALHEKKYTNSRNIGSEGGAIGIVTSGRLKRREYTRQALNNLFSIWKMEQVHDLPR